MKKIIGSVIALILVCVIIAIFASGKDETLAGKIHTYCKENESIKLSEVTDFDWDIAYVDREYYQAGKNLQTQYGIQGKFEMLDSDNLIRIAFCKDNVLVYDMICNEEYIQVDSKDGILERETVLSTRYEVKGDDFATAYLIEE